MHFSHRVGLDDTLYNIKQGQDQLLLIMTQKMKIVWVITGTLNKIKKIRSSVLQCEKVF